MAAAGIQITDTVYDRDSERWLPASRTSSDDYTEYVGVARDRRQYLRPGHEIPTGDGVIVECVVANHTSTSQALMDALQPDVVVISNGTNPSTSTRGR